MKRLVLAAVALGALGGAASAADMAVKAPYRAPPPVIEDWTGFYIGAHAGYGWGRDSFTVGPDLDLFGLVVPASNPKGGVWGGQAGLNKQWGAWVGGLEIDLSGASIKSTTAAVGGGVIPLAPGVVPPLGISCPAVVALVGGSCAASASLEEKIDLLGSARARVGFLAWPNVLFYGTGGLAWTHFKRTINAAETVPVLVGFIPTTLVHSEEVPSWRFGWSAGAGVEGRIFGLLARLEWLHYDFGSSGSATTGATVPAIFAPAGLPFISTQTLRTSDRLSVDVLRVGLSYQFGGGPVYGGPGYGRY